MRNAIILAAVAGWLGTAVAGSAAADGSAFIEQVRPLAARTVQGAAETAARRGAADALATERAGPPDLLPVEDERMLERARPVPVAAGRSNLAQTMQDGDGNRLQARQEGDGNRIGALQVGTGNVALLDQAGRANAIGMETLGVGNAVLVFQRGLANTAVVRQRNWKPAPMH